MNYWIRAYNHKDYRVADYINDHGFIDWEMRHRFEVGDMVLLYLTAPASRITHLMEVTAINLAPESLPCDDEYFITQEAYDRGMAERMKYRYVRYTLVMPLSSPALTLEYLREHGMTGAPRSPRRLPPETVDWVMEHLE